jgi:Ni/Fe-hydrogenase subunit HybB-like protein
MIEKIFNELKSLPKAVFYLAAVVAVGGLTALYRLYAGLGATTNLNKGYPWGVWISFDLSMVAFAGGAFTLAAIVYIFQRKEFHPAVYPTVLTGLVGYSSVLVILFMDLGRWDRFYHFIIYPNINSALFEVSWCILLYSTVLAYEISPVFFSGPRFDRIRSGLKKMTIPMVIAGVTLSTMHQSSLGTLFIVMSTRLHPLWYSLILPVFFWWSSIASGLAMVIGGATVSYWVFGRTLKQDLVAKLGSYLPWVLGIYLVGKVGELLVVGETGLVFSSGRFSILFLTELILGVVIPLVLFSIRKVRQSRIASLGSSVLVILGITLNRFNASWFAMQPPAGYSYFPTLAEILILGFVLAGVILVFTLVSHYFPIFAETEVRKQVLEPRNEEKPTPAPAH